MSRGRVYFIGAGPGDPGLMTLKGRKIIEQAGLVLYAGSLVPREVVAHARGLVRDSSGMDLSRTHNLIRSHVLAGEDVARVHTGDPSLFGAVREQARLLDEEGIDWEIVPGVTAAFAAAARAGMSFTVPEGTQTLIITRAAGRTSVPLKEELPDLAGHGSSLAVYLSARLAPKVQSDLLSAGLVPKTLVVVGHRVGHPDEQVLTTNLSDLAECVSREGFTRQTVFLVLPAEDGARHESRLYDPKFGHGFRNARSESGPAVYAFTRVGAGTAENLARRLGGSLFLPLRLAPGYGARGFASISRLMGETFGAHKAHVFVGAVGIAVRAVAPHLASKKTDPAVVVCDQQGEYVVSLVSGHLGGANALARQVAGMTGGRAVITTGSDVQGAPALDVVIRDLDLFVTDEKALRRAQLALAEGKRVRVFDPQGILSDATKEAWHFQAVGRDECPQIRIQPQSPPREEASLWLVPRTVALGVGCRRGTGAEEIVGAVEMFLEKEGLHPASIVCLAGAELKQDEQGLLDAAQMLGLDLRFFSCPELDAVDVPHPSAVVQKHVGVRSVCEAAAILAGREGRLLAGKTILDRVTLAAAE